MLCLPQLQIVTCSCTAALLSSSWWVSLSNLTLVSHILAKKHRVAPLRTKSNDQTVGAGEVRRGIPMDVSALKDSPPRREYSPVCWDPRSRVSGGNCHQKLICTSIRNTWPDFGGGMPLDGSLDKR